MCIYFVWCNAQVPLITAAKSGPEGNWLWLDQSLVIIPLVSANGCPALVINQCGLWLPGPGSVTKSHVSSQPHHYHGPH